VLPLLLPLPLLEPELLPLLLPLLEPELLPLPLPVPLQPHVWAHVWTPSLAELQADVFCDAHPSMTDVLVLSVPPGQMQLRKGPHAELKVSTCEEHVLSTQLTHADPATAAWYNDARLSGQPEPLVPLFAELDELEQAMNAATAVAASPPASHAFFVIDSSDGSFARSRIGHAVIRASRRLW
jgi:hypothetical protein